MTRLALNIIFAAALIAVGLIAAIGQATAGSESFRRSCDHIRSYTTTQGRVLIAKCYQTGNGCDGGKCYKENARLVIPREGCGDIANREGSLVCLFPGNPGSSLAPPGGSWRASCRDGRYQQGWIFYAVCRTAFGSANGSSINVATCPRPRLRNVNAHLRCE